MSEKTLGETAREAHALAKILVPVAQYDREDIAWQAAADAIAAPLLARIAELEESSLEQIASLLEVGEIYGDDNVTVLTNEHYDNLLTAYQRGVAEGLEQARNLMESNGMEWAAGKIADAIRSASPAVDVTSDKGGER